MKNKILGALSLLSILVVQPVNAALITDPSGLTGAINLIDFDNFTGTEKHEGVNGFLNIGASLGETIEIYTSKDPQDLWLSDSAFILGNNQEWNDTRGGFLGIKQVHDNIHPVRIDFNSGEISGFGFFMNYLIDANTVDETVRLSAYDSGAGLLEEFIINNAATGAGISTPGVDNAGAFRGIQLDSANIKYIELSGYHAVFDDLQFTRTVSTGVTSVPEPASILLLMLGLAGIGASTRNNKQ